MASVAIVIPAYNQAHYLGEAIRSALAQTYADLAVIVVDDGSTDPTREVVESFNDPRITYVYQENAGLSAARNTGIRRTNSPYISFLDSDDLFLPEKLSLLVPLLEKDAEIHLAAGQAVVIDEKGRRREKQSENKIPDPSSRFLLYNPLHVGSVLLRRACLEKIGLFDEDLRAYEDWDLWLRLLRAGYRIAWIDQPVSLYRFHEAQMTRDGTRMRTASLAVLNKTFRDPKLPEAWRTLEDLAYSHSYLRSAAQAYRAGALDRAKLDLAEAVRLNPRLCEQGGAGLAGQFFAWTDDPRTREPLEFLERVYAHLPEELTEMRGRRGHDLAQMAMQTAYQAARLADFPAARAAVLRAFTYNAAWITNRGALSILFRSTFRSQRIKD
jgi:glycosyltransferase involved in cell wall biosynthesis